MKILVVCQYYYPEPVRITDICEELVKNGHEVTILTDYPNYPMGNIYDGYRNKKHIDENVNGVKAPDDLDKSYYVNLAYKRLEQFGFVR